MKLTARRSGKTTCTTPSPALIRSRATTVCTTRRLRLGAEQLHRQLLPQHGETTTGGLSTPCSGSGSGLLPNGYWPVKSQASMLLGAGGDNGDYDTGESFRPWSWRGTPPMPPVARCKSASEAARRAGPAAARREVPRSAPVAGISGTTAAGPAPVPVTEARIALS